MGTKVKDALKSGLKGVLQSLNGLGQGVDNLPSSGIPGSIKTQAEEVLNEIDSLKKTEDFFEQSSRFKQLHDQLQKLGSQGTQDLQEEQAKFKEDSFSSIKKSSVWKKLDDDTRDQIEKDFKSLTVEVDADTAGLKKLVDHEYEINARLRQIKQQAEEVSKKNPRASTGPRISMPHPK